MMIGRVPSPALPNLRPALQLAGPSQSLRSVQGRGTARAAARGRRAAMAPSPGDKEVDLPKLRGTAAGQRRGRRTHRAASYREPELGIPADSGRAPQARLPGRGINDPPGPQGPAD